MVSHKHQPPPPPPPLTPKNCTLALVALVTLSSLLCSYHFVANHKPHGTEPDLHLKLHESHSLARSSQDFAQEMGEAQDPHELYAISRSSGVSIGAEMGGGHGPHELHPLSKRFEGLEVGALVGEGQEQHELRPLANSSEDFVEEIGATLGNVQFPHDAGDLVSSKMENGQDAHGLEEHGRPGLHMEETLKVFMYDMPSEFHFGMIQKLPKHMLWPHITQIPRYPGGLNQQHSPEYWLTLDLLCSASRTRSHLSAAVRVTNWREADIVYVPFFSSLSYNRFSRLDQNDTDTKLQEKLVEFLMTQKPWQKTQGRNHVIVMHHPNSLSAARQKLQQAMFVVSDFGRYPPQVANIRKDIVAPYKHIIQTFRNDSMTFDKRGTLLFFQGAIIRKKGGIIRKRLYELLKNEPNVKFAIGNTQREGIRSAMRGMRFSKFCLHLAGDTPSSNRLFDAIASHCVPVIISDDIELPFEDHLDYSQFCLFIRSVDAVRKGFVIKLLKSISKQEWTMMWKRLMQVDHHFEYQHPSQPDDAVNMIWKTIARRLPSIKQSFHKGKRYFRSMYIKKDTPRK